MEWASEWYFNWKPLKGNQEFMDKVEKDTNICCAKWNGTNHVNGKDFANLEILEDKISYIAS